MSVPLVSILRALGLAVAGSALLGLSLAASALAAETTAQLSERASALIEANPFPGDAIQASQVCESTLLGYPGDGLFTGDVQCVNGGETGFHVYETVDPLDLHPGSGRVDVHYGSGQQKIQDGPVLLPDSDAGAGSTGSDFVLPPGKRGDRFVLGDHRKVYYAGKEAPEAPDEGFVYLTFFEPAFSRVQLHGSPSDYALAPVEEPEAGTAIFLRENSDLLGFIRGVSPEQISDLAGETFVYEARPRAEPAVPGLLQIENRALMTAIESVETDALGNVYLAGSADPAAVPEGEGDAGSMFVGRVDAAGSLVWLRFYDNADAGMAEKGLEGGELPFDMTVADGSVYLCTTAATPGTTDAPGDTNFGRVWRIDATTGEVAAALDTNRFFEDSWTACGGVTTDGAGHVYVTGEFQTVLTAAPFVAKLRADDLSLVWLADDVYEEEEREGLGLVLLREAWGGIVFHPTGPLPGQGVVMASGYTWSPPTLSPDALLSRMSVYAVQYDAWGRKLWRKEFGGNGLEWPWSSDVDAEGNYYISGLSTSTRGFATRGPEAQGSGEGFVAKVAPDGELVWVRLVTSPDGEEVREVKVGREGLREVLYAVGHTFQGASEEPSDPRRDVFAVKLTTEGRELDRIQFGTEKDEHASLGVFGETLFIGGQTYGSMVGANSGGIDFYLTRLDGRSFEFLEE